MISRIEIDFAIPVELSADDYREFDHLVRRITNRHQPEGFLHWCSSHGSKPIWSQADAKFMGKPIDPDAPVSGEPTWDESVYCIETWVW